MRLTADNRGYDVFCVCCYAEESTNELQDVQKGLESFLPEFFVLKFGSQDIFTFEEWCIPPYDMTFFHHAGVSRWTIHVTGKNYFILKFQVQHGSYNYIVHHCTLRAAGYKKAWLFCLS